MILGHFGAAFAAKRYALRTSLGTLNFAAEFLDELWPIFLLMGLESVRIAPGVMAANPLVFEHYPITHSLVSALGWSVLVGGLYFVVRRGRRAAILVGALVLSHWLLDVPMHAPDLPLWPGSDIKLGLGAWRSIPLTVALEFAVFGAGLAVYLRTTRAKNGRGKWGLWAMVAVLVLIFVGNLFSPPPTSQRAVATGTLGLWIFVPWGWWVERHREPVIVGT